MYWIFNINNNLFHIKKEQNSIWNWSIAGYNLSEINTWFDCRISCYLRHVIVYRGKLLNWSFLWVLTLVSFKLMLCVAMRCSIVIKIWKYGILNAGFREGDTLQSVAILWYDAIAALKHVINIISIYDWLKFNFFVGVILWKDLWYETLFF